MSESDNTLSQLQVEASSFSHKARDKWVEAVSLDSSQELERQTRLNAGPRTPNEYHNQSGPDSDPKPDPALVPSLMTLAATLGIPMLVGERLLDGQEPLEFADDDSMWELSDPGVFLDE